MLGFIKNWLDDNARELKKIKPLVEKVNAMEAKMAGLSEDGLKSMTPHFRDRLDRGETLDDLLPEAFALVRETAKRVLNMRHFDVQLIGGIVLHKGRIAEMKTGEGKTLVATLPVYLNALSGKGVHVITVNDYLARRDSEWMGQIYSYLGLEVGLIVHGLNWDSRRNSYGADITYGTNNEFGFDYLRDNMAQQTSQLVQRELNFAIVDEVDSILIDEARTPLIISGQGSKSTDMYSNFSAVVSRLKLGIDYVIDEKSRSSTITETGVSKVEKMLNVENLYDDQHTEMTHHLNQALKAHGLMKRDRDYVVKDGQVIIVDEFTGRLMFGRRYSDGLHQAIEAKEKVKIERESQTLASITFQNYFRMYDKLAGMTGTAETEEQEFKKIYKLDVVVIPGNKPLVREDLPDVIYKTEQAKFKAVVDEIESRHSKGQPILVGTIAIDKSEVLSKMLRHRGIDHQVLNAKFHDKEAEIVAQAGRFGAVTIATNMAGRGTDILLGGNPEFLTRQELRKKQLQDKTPVVETDEADDPAYQGIFKEMRRESEAERDKVVALGGLYIMGTERHESRRIDNQLRGRCGRQGDPGASQFFSSMEDDLLRLFGSDNVSGIMEKLGIEEDMPIEHNMITKSIESAQKRVENRNFDIRKHVLQYDDVMNQQRELIYQQRRQVLSGNNLRDTIIEMISDAVKRAVAAYAPDGVHPDEWDMNGLLTHAEQLFLPGNAGLTPEALTDLSRFQLEDTLLDRAEGLYAEREQEIGEEDMRILERAVMLRVVDEKWMDQLDAMDQLREGISLRAYGQKDPLIEYKMEGYDMFQNMVDSIQDDVVRYIYRVKILQQAQVQPRKTVENRYQEEGPKRPVRREQKVGRNDMCPCGSGKKFKKCCGMVAV
ncbi:MAG: preprotein translocase subunit SecA [Peptococcaceae bacterium]|nr:preprotein translocase subunit SecA [Peptococcaceae bacterium]